MKHLSPLIALFGLLVYASTGTASPPSPQGQSQEAAIQAANARQLASLGQRLDKIESRADRTGRSSSAPLLFLFGAFCALWAQNTRRDPWLWFFLGAFFNVFAVIVALSKNADDQRSGGAPVERDWWWVGLMLALILATFVFLWVVSFR